MYGTKKKTSSYNKGGSMPMVMKEGKKVPAYAADGVGKMNKGGMTKKKMMGGMQSTPGTVNTNVNTSYPAKDSIITRPAMTKPNVMTYNMGGMVKSQVDNLKKKKNA
jgi:hypothetical protein